MLIDIVLVCALGRGGLENTISMISRELILRGNRVRVIQVFKSKYVEWIHDLNEFYTLTNIEFNRDISVNRMSEMYSDFMVNNGRPDVVIAAHTPASTYIWHESLRMIDKTEDIPLISWVHGPLPAYGLNYDKLLSFADAHLAISGQIENQLIGLTEKVSVYLTHNPVCVNKSKIERDDEKFSILYVGRLESEKKVDLLLDAVSNLEEKWKLDIIGDGSEKDKLENIVKGYGLSEKVKFYGWKEEPWNCVTKANILVVPSEQEGFGLVMTEALSYGIPVLATRTEGAVDIIKDGINGWLVDVDDVGEMKAVLCDISCGNIELPSEEECIKSVSEFRVEETADKIERALIIECNKKKSLQNLKTVDIVLNYLSGKGGTENVLKLVINYLNKNGYRVRIIQSYKFESSQWLKKCNVEVYTLFQEEVNTIPETSEFAKEYEKVMSRFGEPKVMIATGIPYMSYMCSEARRLLKIKVRIISWIHNPLNAFENNGYIKYADAHMAISKEIQEQIRSVDPGTSIDLVYNPIKIDKMKISRVYNRLNLLYIGRLCNKQKNLSMMFNALAKINGKWSLDIFGDGEDYNWLYGLAEIFAINSNINWNRWVDNPWNEVRGASLLLLTSNFEGFGLVVIESLSKGIPVICTKCGVAKEIITNGYNGWIVKSEVELKELLQNIIDKKIELPTSENCMSSVKKFSDKIILEKIKEIIDTSIKLV